MDKELSAQRFNQKIPGMFSLGHIPIVEACKIYIATIDANPEAKEIRGEISNITAELGNVTR